MTFRNISVIVTCHCYLLALLLALLFLLFAFKSLMFPYRVNQRPHKKAGFFLLRGDCSGWTGMLCVNGISARESCSLPQEIQGFSCYHSTHFLLTCPCLSLVVIISLVIIVEIVIVNHFLHGEFGISPTLSNLIFTTTFPEVISMHIF